MSKISEFVTTALEDTMNDHAEFILGVMSNAQGQKIASETGVVSIAGAEKVLTAHGVRHAFVRHQAKKNEADRGQVTITIEDFEFLTDILSNPISVERGDLMNRKNNDVLKFSKKVKGRLYNVLMSVTRNTKRTKLFFNTMFIKV